MRANAMNGLQSIIGAYENGTYMPDMSAPWRQGIAETYMQFLGGNDENGKSVGLEKEEIEAEIEAYWKRQDEYFSDGWWLDEDKKKEAIRMLLLESLLIEDERGNVGGYDLMEHYTGSEPGNPKRYALQIMFQLEPIDGDDEIVLNNIAGACAREGIDIVGNGWVIPPEIMQFHALYYKELPAECDMNEKQLLSCLSLLQMM